MKISLTEPLFVHREACEITGVPPMTLLNWTQREPKKPKPHEVMPGTVIRGRRLYSIIDLVKLHIIGNLATFVKLGPAFGLAIAHQIEPRASEIAALGEDGELLHRGYKGDEAPQYLIAYAEPQIDNFKVARVTEPNLVKVLTKPHPVVVVPLDEIALTITLKCLRRLDDERPAE